MKTLLKVLETITEKLLMASGYITSITIILMVVFLFREGAGLFNTPDIEEGYVLAVNRENPVQKLSPQPELALIDGNRTKDFGLPVRTIVKGDSLSASIAAASILAKVTRDRLMEEYDAQYPQYGFAVHKGYGTKRHYEALREFGPSPIHRKTFLKKFYENP